MTIAEFLEAANMPDAMFASRIGVSRQSLHRYKTGERRPEWPVIQRIVSATNGAVTANDFLPDAPSSLPAQEERA